MTSGINDKLHHAFSEIESKKDCDKEAEAVYRKLKSEIENGETIDDLSEDDLKALEKYLKEENGDSELLQEVQNRIGGEQQAEVGDCDAPIEEPDEEEPKPDSEDHGKEQDEGDQRRDDRREREEKDGRGKEDECEEPNSGEGGGKTPEPGEDMVTGSDMPFPGADTVDEANPRSEAVDEAIIPDEAEDAILDLLEGKDFDPIHIGKFIKEGGAEDLGTYLAENFSEDEIQQFTDQVFDLDEKGESEFFPGAGREEIEKYFDAMLNGIEGVEIEAPIEIRGEDANTGAGTDTTDGTGTPTPATGTPATGTPATGTPATGTPATGTPTTGTPATGTPTTATPATGTPATGTPATGTPATGTPATGTPATGTPTTGTPTTGTPTTGTPTTGTEDMDGIAMGGTEATDIDIEVADTTDIDTNTDIQVTDTTDTDTDTKGEKARDTDTDTKGEKARDTDTDTKGEEGEAAIFSKAWSDREFKNMFPGKTDKAAAIPEAEFKAGVEKYAKETVKLSDEDAKAFAETTVTKIGDKPLSFDNFVIELDTADTDGKDGVSASEAEDYMKAEETGNTQEAEAATAGTADIKSFEKKLDEFYDAAEPAPAVSKEEFTADAKRWIEKNCAGTYDEKNIEAFFTALDAYNGTDAENIDLLHKDWSEDGKLYKAEKDTPEAATEVTQNMSPDLASRATENEDLWDFIEAVNKYLKKHPEGEKFTLDQAVDWVEAKHPEGGGYMNRLDEWRKAFETDNGQLPGDTPPAAATTGTAAVPVTDQDSFEDAVKKHLAEHYGNIGTDADLNATLNIAVEWINNHRSGSFNAKNFEEWKNDPNVVKFLGEVNNPENRASAYEIARKQAADLAAEAARLAQVTPGDTTDGDGDKVTVGEGDIDDNDVTKGSPGKSPVHRNAGITDEALLAQDKDGDKVTVREGDIDDNDVTKGSPGKSPVASGKLRSDMNNDGFYSVGETPPGINPNTGDPYQPLTVEVLREIEEWVGDRNPDRPKDRKVSIDEINDYYSAPQDQRDATRDRIAEAYVRDKKSAAEKSDLSDIGINGTVQINHPDPVQVITALRELAEASPTFKAALKYAVETQGAGVLTIGNEDLPSDKLGEAYMNTSKMMLGDIAGGKDGGGGVNTEEGIYRVIAHEVGHLIQNNHEKIPGYGGKYRSTETVSGANDPGSGNAHFNTSEDGDLATGFNAESFMGDIKNDADKAGIPFVLDNNGT